MRSLAVAALLVALVAVALVARNEKPYRLSFEVENASGLIEGAPVVIAGSPVGQVEELALEENVLVELAIDEDQAPVRSDLDVAIESSNLLGSKQVSIEPGEEGDPLPSGTTLPEGEVDVPVDLQEVLDVLDGETRAALSILINEAGLGLTGRATDFNRLLQRLPTGFDQLTELLEQLQADNEALGNTIAQSDTFLATLTPKREDLGDFVDQAAGTMETLVERRDELASTLDRAPAALGNARRFLAELRRTAAPLGSAARALTESAEPLRSTLAAVPGFTRAARPALRQARRAAPRLTALGRIATPTVRRLRPASRALARLGTPTRALSDTLEMTAPDLLGLIEGWSRAIQMRDGLGHYFRADVNFSPDAIQSLLAGLGLSAAKSNASGRAIASRRTSADRTPPFEIGKRAPGAAGEKSAAAAPNQPAQSEALKPQSAAGLLDYLLEP